MRVVNVFDCELSEGPGREGFWFRAAELRPALDAVRIGAGVYEAREGVPIWPYHYHYPDEEWLYVLDGAPVLRDPDGRRALKAGTVVCFPTGHRGAHTLEGPGRFILFSGERSAGPFVSVYPDSDKVSVVPGMEPEGLNALRLRRAGSVDYWDGEGEGPVAPAPVVREAAGVSGRAVVNVDDLTFEAGDGWRWGPLGGPVDGAQLDAAILELEPGADFGAYHYEVGRELWLLALTGVTTVQHTAGETALSPGDIASLPEGPAGGRALHNRSRRSARILLLWTIGFPSASCDLITDEWVLRPAPGAEEIRLRRGCS